MHPRRSVGSSPRRATGLAVRLAIASFIALAAAGCSPGCSRDPKPAAPPSESAVWRQDSIRNDRPFARVPAPEGAAPRRGGRVVIAILSEPDSLNPFTSTVREAHEIQDQIYPHLALEEPDYDRGPPSFLPGLAERWTPGDDGLSIRFFLRETKWSDGRPVSAADVRFTWQAAVSDEVAWSSAESIAGEIEDVVIHSDRVLTVRFRRRSPYQLMDICDLRVIPKHVYERIPLESWKTHGRFIAEARIAAGPWRLKSHRPNEEIVLEPNPQYWEEGKPYLDELVFRVVPDTSLQVDWLRAGDAHFIRVGTPDRVPEILEDPHLRLIDFASRGFGAIWWNTQRAPLDDARVRRAIGHAIDREDIVDLFLGYATVPRSHLLSSFWAFAPDLPALDYSPETASKLLAEAGYSRGSDEILEKDGERLVIDLTTNGGNTLRQRLLELVRDDLHEVGIEARINLPEPGAFVRSLRTREFPGGALTGMNVATKVDLRAAWHSAGIEGGFNYSSFRDERVDELIDRARSMLDLEASKPLWREVQMRLWKEQPSTMLYERRELIATSKRLVNLRMTSLRALDNSHEWWLTAEAGEARK